MKSSFKRFLAGLMAAMLAIGLFTFMPRTASADDGIMKVTEHPAGATYYLNDPAAPMVAKFTKDASITDVKLVPGFEVKWYSSVTNDNSDRSNPIAADTITLEADTIVTTYTPPTDVLGVTYYFAVMTYEEQAEQSLIHGNKAETVEREAVTNTARIEVIDQEISETHIPTESPTPEPTETPTPEPTETPTPTPTPAPSEHTFNVRKTDENGKLLSGAIFILVPDAGYIQDKSVIVYEKTTVNGIAVFVVKPGHYILSEKLAPEGFNATDEKYLITVTENGVFITLSTSPVPYETITFVNKEIPALNKDDHFAYMVGYPDGTFGPARNMTRAEAVVMFSRLLSKSINMNVDYRNNYYPDVELNKWYANQVCYMQTLGVLANFCRDGRFRPNEFVTRAEFATLAAHFDNLTLTSANVFSDVATDHWAVKYINSAAAKGWIIGYTDGTFKPESNIVRAEVVTLVNKILNRYADAEYLRANANSLPRNYTDLTPAHWAYLAIMEASIGHDFIRDGSAERWTSVY